MRIQLTSRWLAVTALLGMAIGGVGCVLVVGDGTHRGGEVEWASGSRDAPAVVHAPSAENRLAREVDSRLRLDGALAGEDITVSASGAAVTLHGRVADVARLEHAMRVAADVPGVARVISRLTVELEGS